jgi:hypothetical protein
MKVDKDDKRIAKEIKENFKDSTEFATWLTKAYMRMTDEDKKRLGIKLDD